MRKLRTLFLLIGLTPMLAIGSDSPAEKPSPTDVIEMLKAGNARFVAGETNHPNTDAARLALAGSSNQGNYAYATVLSCSDSRVPVERIFDAGVMDIFVIRIAGNVADVDQLGSIEYGVNHVHTPVTLVLGHTQCGAVAAVTAAVKGAELKLERNIPPLVDNIIPAVERTLDDLSDADEAEQVARAVEENVWQSIRDMLYESPALREAHKTGKTMIVGAIYDIATGQVNWLPNERVDVLLAEVEADSDRPMNPYGDDN